MTEVENTAELAALKARIAQLEGRRKGLQGQRRVGVMLGVGVLLFPYIFAWLLLRKGYSSKARLIGFGWLTILVVVIAANQGKPTPSGTSVATNGASAPVNQTVMDPHAGAKEVLAAEAKREVPKFMKDPASARFGQVWGTASGMACGFVNGKNSFGAMTGEERFIFALGEAEFDNHSGQFAKHWNTLCVDKLLSTAPAEVDGKRWGSPPTADLKQNMAQTDDGLSLYVPKAASAPFGGIPVKESDYLYDHRKLYAVDFYIDGEANREAAKAALLKRYGTPLEYNDNLNIYKWKWPQKHVSVRFMYEEKFKRSTISFAHDQ